MAQEGLSGCRVLVTGGARGIGRAISEAFAERGARVGVHYRQDSGAAETLIAGLPGDGHLSLAAELAEPVQCRRLVDDAVDRLGGLDILVNNAGIYSELELSETGYADFVEDWQRTLAVNLQGPACVSFLAAGHMRAGGGGRIINVSSRGAFRGEPTAVAYGASKAGLNALTQSLAQALAAWDIQVAAVAPGFVETDMTADILAGPRGEDIRRQSPTGRVARPEEVAAAVVFLASPGSEFCTGTIIDVNGASHLRQ